MKINKQGGITEFSNNIAISILEAAKSIVEATTSMLNSLGRIAIGAGRSIQKVLEFLPSGLGGLKTLEAIKIELLDIAMQREKLSESADSAIWGADSLLDDQEIALRKLITSGDYLQEIKPFQSFQTGAAILEINELLMKMKEVNIASEPVKEASVKGLENPLLEANAREYQDAFDHQRAMGELSSNYLLREEKKRRDAVEFTHQMLAKQSAIQKAAQVKGVDDLKDEGRETLAALSGNFKAAFALNKAFALKDAIVSTYLAVSKALASAPFPINLGLGALALANGMAQVQAIRSTSFREKGGPISAGNPYIVGERGPELIVPNQAANVIPNDQLGGGNFTINISANDTAGFDQLLMKRRGTIMGLINQSLNERGRPALA